MYDAEAVPTSVVGPDGAWYVGELKGFPFTPGTSRVRRIQPGTLDVTCDSGAAKTAACSLYTSGLTSIIDITFDKHALYVLGPAKGGVAAVEGGDPNSPPPGVLLKRWAASEPSSPRDRSTDATVRVGVACPTTRPRVR